MTSKQIFDGAIRLSVERWRAQSAAADAEGFKEISIEICMWIAAVEPILAM